MNAALYTTEILRLAASLPPPAQLDRIDARAEMRSPTCGSRIVVTVRIDDGRIAALSQEVHACAFGQAAAALMERSAPGRDRSSVARAAEELADWLGSRRDDAGSWPGLAALAPARSRTARHAAILLPFRALLAALDEAAER